ncbi:MAG: hypothetical protein Q9219_006081 [cf. Caloplaca sp. 3 TL-2023]
MASLTTPFPYSPTAILDHLKFANPQTATLSPGSIYYLSAPPTLTSKTLNPGIFNHPVLIISVDARRSAADILIISSLDGKTLSTYTRSARIRATHVPIHPCEPHPDNGSIAHLSTEGHLPKKSFIKTEMQHTVPQALLQPLFDQRSREQFRLEPGCFEGVQQRMMATSGRKGNTSPVRSSPAMSSPPWSGSLGRRSFSTSPMGSSWGSCSSSSSSPPILTPPATPPTPDRDEIVKRMRDTSARKATTSSSSSPRCSFSTSPMGSWSLSLPPTPPSPDAFEIIKGMRDTSARKATTSPPPSHTPPPPSPSRRRYYSPEELLALRPAATPAPRILARFQTRECQLRSRVRVAAPLMPPLPYLERQWQIPASAPVQTAVNFFPACSGRPVWG